MTPATGPHIVHLVWVGCSDDGDYTSEVVAHAFEDVDMATAYAAHRDSGEEFARVQTIIVRTTLPGSVRVFAAEAWAQHVDLVALVAEPYEQANIASWVVEEGQTYITSWADEDDYSRRGAWYPAAVVDTSVDGFVAVEGTNLDSVIALLAEIVEAHPAYPV